MVISLARYTGLQDLATAEDIVQEAFAVAAEKWDQELPSNPEAWLYRVCRNIALNKIRQVRKNPQVPLDDQTSVVELEQVFHDDGDDQLKMLLACAHPHFSAKNQVIFALRYVGGFRIEQIANILGSPSDTITKTLLRMRDTIVRERIEFQSDLTLATPSQVQTLHQVVYLLFAEGYKTSTGRSILNLQLCEDALALALAMAETPPLGRPETHALVALMLFNLSRFEARFTPSGDMIELEHQDRSLWNRALIQVGVHHMSLSGDEATSYHLEAVIAWLHVSAPSFAETDWKRIAQVYDRLLQIQDSPFVRMNQAVALLYAGDTLTALHRLRKIGEMAFLQRHYLYHLALGRVYRIMGDVASTREHYTRALSLGPHEIERRYIQNLLDELPA